MALESRPMPWSYADYVELTPEGPGELIEGVYVVSPTPSPHHQRIVEERRVDVFSTLDARGYDVPRELALEDTLTSDLLPGFALPLAKLFPDGPQDTD